MSEWYVITGDVLGWTDEIGRIVPPGEGSILETRWPPLT
jgi:hypothetical protein